MAKKKQTSVMVNKESQISSSAISKQIADDVSVHKEKQELNFNNYQANGIRHRIIDRNTIESTEDNSTNIKKAVKEGIQEGMSEPMSKVTQAIAQTGSINRSQMESTIDGKAEGSSSNGESSDEAKERKDAIKAIENLAKEQARSQQNWHEKVTATVAKVDNFGGEQWRGKSSYALSLGAEAISPALGKAVQFAITSGLGKSLWNVLAPDKKKKEEEERHAKVIENLNTLHGDVSGLSETTKKLFGLQNEDSSAKATKEASAKAQAEEVSEQTKRLFGIQVENSKALQAMGQMAQGVKRFFTGAGLLALADYLFNDEFRATVNGYIKSWWRGIGGPIEFGVKAIAKVIDTVWGPTKGVFVGLWSLGAKIGSVVAGVVNGGIKAFGMLKNGSRKMLNSVKNFFPTTSKALGEMRDSLVNKFKSAGLKIASGAKSVFNNFKGKLLSAGSSAKGLLTSVVKTVTNPLKGLGQKILNGFMWPINMLKNFFSKAISSIAGLLGKIPGFKKFFGSMAKDISEKVAQAGGAKGLIKKASVGLGGIVKKFASKAGPAIAGLGGMSKKIMKKVPGVGTAITAVSAAKRAIKGDWAGAGLELVSAALTAIPYVGTVASIGVDGWIAARDVAKAKSDPTATATEKWEVEKPEIVKAQENVNISGNLQTSKNIKTAQMEAAKEKVIIVQQQQQTAPADQPVVNTLPSNPAMRPSLG